jgi:hypothetical protein
MSWSQSTPWRSHDLVNELIRMMDATPQERVAHFVRRFPSFDPSKLQDVKYYEPSLIQLIMPGGRVLLQTTTTSPKLSFYAAESSQKYSGYVDQSEIRETPYDDALHMSGNRYLVKTPSGLREVTGVEHLMPPGSINHWKKVYGSQLTDLTVRLRPYYSKYAEPEYGFVMQLVGRNSRGHEIVAYESPPEKTSGPVTYAQFDAKHPDEKFQIAYKQSTTGLPYIGESRRFWPVVKQADVQYSNIYVSDVVRNSQRTVPVETFEGLGDPATPPSHSGRSSNKICKSLFAL